MDFHFRRYTLFQQKIRIHIDKITTTAKQTNLLDKESSLFAKCIFENRIRMSYYITEHAEP